MENICSACFQPAELFQVPGYTLPTCMKCSRALAAKGVPPNFYMPVTAANSVATVATAAATISAKDEPPGVGGGGALSNAALHQPSQFSRNTSPPESATHNEDVPQQHIPTQEEMLNLKKRAEALAFELEHQLQNMDNDLLFAEEGTCPLCSKTFARKASLLTHVRNHTAERKYVCNYCQKGFTQAANLRNHERIHTNERPYVCIDCGKAFTQVTNLNNHRRLHTGERPFVCIEADCGRSFAQVTNLNNHMKTHHKIQQYVCNQCPKKFTQVTSLNQHLLIHSGITTLMCPHCPEKTFKQYYQLQSHMKSHGLSFPYECSKCQEKFVQVTHYKQHMQMHEDLKYRCNMCPSSFGQEVHLKKHIQRHIDGRYITCPVIGCAEGFSMKHDLNKHMKMHHPTSELPRRISVKRTHGKRKCYFESCDEAFNDADALNLHLRSIHGLSIMKEAASKKRTKMEIMMAAQVASANLQKETNHLLYQQSAAAAAAAAASGSSGGGGGDGAPGAGRLHLKEEKKDSGEDNQMLNNAMLHPSMDMHYVMSLQLGAASNFWKAAASSQPPAAFL